MIHGRTLRLVLAGAACTALIAAAGDSAQAAKKSKRRKTKLSIPMVQTPTGLQGLAGAGEAVLVAFQLRDRTRRRSVVEVEYGVDYDGDGVIADGTDPESPSEFRSATHELRDGRDTRKLRKSKNGKRTFALYRPGTAAAGALHLWSWNQLADIGVARFAEGDVLARTVQGRPDVNPLDPDTPIFEQHTGVRLRVRAIRNSGPRAKTDWVTTEAFAIDNTTAPGAVIEGGSADAAAGTIDLEWAAFSRDTEDLDADGELDPLDGEDRNGNGVLDHVNVAVAFDWYALADGETIPSTDAELAGLDWRPCTRADLGDPDDGVPSGGLGIGTRWTFVWDFVANVGQAPFSAGDYLFRAVPYSDSGRLGEADYLTTPVTIVAPQ